MVSATRTRDVRPRYGRRRRRGVRPGRLGRRGCRVTSDRFGSVFGPIGTGRSFEKIVASLRGAIVRGDLSPGERLPSEAELATQLEVSRPLLREALKALELSGYLQVRRGYGGGRFVATPAAEEFHTIQAAALSPLDVSPHHVRDVRVAIEPMAARRAAEAKDSTDLRQAWTDLAPADDPPARAVATIVQVHGALVEASGNPAFVAIFDGLRGSVAASLGTRVQNANWRETCKELLGGIVDRVENGDADGAETSTRTYLIEHEYGTDEKSQQ
ncbi:MAG: GntR family transcriptional regulator [Streptosporangiales bacterium]|nr:GntR family transcriptional regulator [Streptosporangiales bacterium]